MSEAALIVAALVPFAFIMIIFIFYLYRIKLGCNVVNYFQYIINISVIILSITYLYMKDINFAEFFRKLLILYIPNTLVLFGYLIQAYTTYPPLMFSSITLSIIHTEAETTKIPYIFVISSYFLFFHIFTYFFSFKWASDATVLVEKSWIYKFISACIIPIILIYLVVISYVKPFGIGQLICSILILLFNIDILMESKMKKWIDQETRVRAYCTLVSITCSVLTYMLDKSVFSILTPIFCLLVPIINLIFYFSTFSYNGDIYTINWLTKSARMIHKGAENNVIADSIICNGTVIKVKSYDSYYLNNNLGNFDSLVIQSKLVKVERLSCKAITIDFDLTDERYIEDILVKCHVTDLTTTEKCRKFVSNNGKLFSKVEMNLVFCSRIALHLTINESCLSVNKCACQNCYMLKIIVIPSSLVKIEDHAFSQCHLLVKLLFRENSRLKSIGKSAFFDADLRKVYFPSTLESIGESAFLCPRLREVVFPPDSCIKPFEKQIFNNQTLITKL